MRGNLFNINSAFSIFFNFSLKSKHVARNKTDINLVVVDSLYFPFYCHKGHLVDVRRLGRGKGSMKERD